SPRYGQLGPRHPTLFLPYTTLFRSVLHVSWNYRDQRYFEAVSGLRPAAAEKLFRRMLDNMEALSARGWFVSAESMMTPETAAYLDRKSTRLNSSHVKISYAVFCLKK